MSEKKEDDTRQTHQASLPAVCTAVAKSNGSVIYGRQATTSRLRRAGRQQRRQSQQERRVLREQEVQVHQKRQEHQEPKAEVHCKLQVRERLHLGAGCPGPRSKHVQTCTNDH